MENTTCHYCDCPATTELGIFGVMRPICHLCEEEINYEMNNSVFDVC